MPNYTKLFNSIITSTIWTEDDKTRIMWITMLAMSDKNGEVHASIPGLARVSGISLEDAEKSINKLLSPDAYSRTPDNEGRRITPIDGGWELLNHAKYRLMASKEDEKAANAERVRRHRARNGDVTVGNGDVTVGNGDVTVGNGDVTVDRDIAEAKAESDPFKIPPNPQGGISRPRRKKLNPKITRVFINTETMIRINGWFGRRPETLWTISESEALEEVNPSAAEIDGMEAFYLADEDPANPLHRRTNLSTLLNNWPSELDKARGYARKQRGAA